MPITLELLPEPEHKEGELDEGVGRTAGRISVLGEGEEALGEDGGEVWGENLKCFKEQILDHY